MARFAMLNPHHSMLHTRPCSSKSLIRLLSAVLACMLAAAAFAALTAATLQRSPTCLFLQPAAMPAPATTVHWTPAAQPARGTETVGQPQGPAPTAENRKGVPKCSLLYVLVVHGRWHRMHCSTGGLCIKSAPGFEVGAFVFAWKLLQEGRLSASAGKAAASSTPCNCVRCAPRLLQHPAAAAGHFMAEAGGALAAAGGTLNETATNGTADGSGATEPELYLCYAAEGGLINQVPRVYLPPPAKLAPVAPCVSVTTPLLPTLQGSYSFAAQALVHLDALAMAVAVGAKGLVRVCIPLSAESLHDFELQIRRHGRDLRQEPRRVLQPSCWMSAEHPRCNSLSAVLLVLMSCSLPSCACKTQHETHVSAATSSTLCRPWIQCASASNLGGADESKACMLDSVLLKHPLRPVALADHAAGAQAGRLGCAQSCNASYIRPTTSTMASKAACCPRRLCRRRVSGLAGQRRTRRNGATRRWTRFGTSPPCTPTPPVYEAQTIHTQAYTALLCLEIRTHL